MNTFSKSLPMMMHHTLDVIIPRYREVFRKDDLSEQQWRILRVLWELDDCTSAELAKKTLLPSPSMVGIIDRMMMKGLVIRDRNIHDRRIVNVRLTDRGKSLQSKLMPQLDSIYEELVQQCDPNSWRIMINTLQTIIDTQKQT